MNASKEPWLSFNSVSADLFPFLESPLAARYRPTSLEPASPPEAARYSLIRPSRWAPIAGSTDSPVLIKERGF